MILALQEADYNNFNQTINCLKSILKIDYENLNINMLSYITDLQNKDQQGESNIITSNFSSSGIFKAL